MRPCRRCGSGSTGRRCIRWFRSFCCRRWCSSWSIAFPFDTPKGWRKERISVYLTNLGIGAFLLTLTLLLGWEPVLLVQLPVIIMASIIGVWLFSVQHRFEHSLWARQAEWTAAGAALHGSSWLRLPKVLQWFTGNIGFHHVHHLVPRVPNYRLQAAHRAEPAFAANVTGLTLMAGAAGAQLHAVG